MDGTWSGPSEKKVSFGGSSWTKPTSNSSKRNDPKTNKSQKKPPKKVVKETPSRVLNSSVNDTPKYKSLIVDSGAIIKHSAFSTLHNAASEYYTVQAVLDEIRDKKARSHLESLPFKLQIRQPSSEGLSKVSEFSRLTGDYQSLSRVDLQVLGLLYDLEFDGCNGDMAHIRTTPKRAKIGRITNLNKNETKTEEGTKNSNKSETASSSNNESTNETNQPDSLENPSFFEVSPEDIDLSEDEEEEDDYDTENQEGVASSNNSETKVDTRAPAAKKSWAMAVNPTAASKSNTTLQEESSINKPDDIANRALYCSFGSMNISSNKNNESKSKNIFSKDDSNLGGQFDDAEEDDDFQAIMAEENESDDDFQYDSGMEISDEECDVIVLDPDEVEARKKEATPALEDDLESEFPSLSAAATVPEDLDEPEPEPEVIVNLEELMTKDSKSSSNNNAKDNSRSEALKPLTKNGHMYNSFRKYQHLVSSEGINRKKKSSDEKKEDITPTQTEKVAEADAAAGKNTHSRIMGGIGMSGQGTEVEDDGEGWVTNVKEISSMKAMGTLDPGRAPNENSDQKPKDAGPPISSRAACATTDFAMQNVILQMNLELLTVDGMKVRKLKSWVTRCGACFTVYSSADNNAEFGNSKMMFCKRCGSDFLQRIAASVDGKTGRLRLHLRRNYTQNTRGTKFALPKPGQGNRFHGDLLLREDQLLVGAWNQKRKKVSGKKEAQSIFGSDIASYVGCHKNMGDGDDLRIGFGRKNPNATKFGRERRGKKKKSSDKACGLRRYAN